MNEDPALRTLAAALCTTRSARSRGVGNRRTVAPSATTKPDASKEMHFSQTRTSLSGSRYRLTYLSDRIASVFVRTS